MSIMRIEEIMKKFGNKEVFDDVRFLLTSSMRSKLIISLYYGKKKLVELREDLNKPSATIWHGLKELEKLDLITKEDKCYMLSSRGYLLALNMLKLIENWYSIEYTVDFWLNHTIHVIPEKFMKNSYLLKGAECISSSGNDVSKPLTKYLTMIKGADEMNIILPIFSKIHLDAIFDNLSGGVTLNLITTSGILDSFKKEGYMKKIFDLIEDNNINLWRYDGNLKIFMTCTESFVSLNLFFEDGYYDDSKMLLNENLEGIQWGKNLFEYYKNKCLEIPLI